jgi:hypothetical protein
MLKMKITPLIYFLCLSFFFLTFSIPSAHAHDASLTYTSITVTGTMIDVAITTPYNNILGYYPIPNKTIDNIDLKFFQKPFENGFVIQNDGQKCIPNLIDVKNITDIKGIAYHFRYTCKNSIDKLHFTYNLFFNISEIHENITDIQVDKFRQQLIFSKTNPVLDIDYPSIKSKINNFQMLVTIGTFLKIGILHILTGYDHILFLISLHIITKNIKSLLKIVSAFTLTHSITLSLATMGIFVLPARFTESMIAVSIAYVAFENVKIVSSPQENTRLGFINKLFFTNQSKRWMISFFFGLIHGFSFSSALRDLGLQQQSLVFSLLSFNVGVEIGQLIIIALMFPVLWYIRRQVWEVKAVKTASVVIGCIGVFLFTQRLFF